MYFILWVLLRKDPELQTSVPRIQNAKQLTELKTKTNRLVSIWKCYSSRLNCESQRGCQNQNEAGQIKYKMMSGRRIMFKPNGSGTWWPNYKITIGPRYELTWRRLWGWGLKFQNPPWFWTWPLTSETCFGPAGCPYAGGLHLAVRLSKAEQNLFWVENYK